MPTPKSGLAKGLFPDDLHAAAKCLVLIGKLFWAMHPVKTKTCRRKEVTGACLEMLHTISLPAGRLHIMHKMSFPGVLDCALNLSISSKVSGCFVGTEEVLPVIDSLGKCILTTLWSHQVFELLCLLKKPCRIRISLGCVHHWRELNVNFTFLLWLVVERARGQLTLGKQCTAGCLLLAPHVAPDCPGGQSATPVMRS